MSKQQISTASAELWQGRWDSFLFMWDQACLRWDRLHSYYIDNKAKQHPKLEDQLSVLTVKALLERLLYFSKQHFFFFYNGLVGNSLYSFALLDDAELLKGTRFKWLHSNYSIGEYILTTIIEQATHDLIALDHAIEQRFMAVTTVDGLPKPSIDSGLERDLSAHRTITHADELAFKAISLFNNTFTFYQYATAITYQCSSTTVRVIPYAPVALLGLPISILGAPEDMLAIPHEVGHFLYWNGQRTSEGRTVSFRTLLAEAIKNSPGESFIEHPWLEEIVADVVSCLIAGPLTAHSIQQLMQTVAGDEFVADNHTHPVPAIRPYIYTNVLANKMGLSASAKQLREAWENLLGPHGRKVDYTKKVGTHTLQSLLDSVQKPEGDLYQLVATIADLVVFDQGQSPSFWSHVNPADPIEELIPHFKEALKRDEDEAVKERIQRNSDVNNTVNAQRQRNASANNSSSPQALALPTSEVDRFWLNQIKPLFGEAIPSWLNETLLQPSSGKQELISAASAPHLIPASEWLTVFDAGGWGSEGGGPTNLKTGA